jgi:hypothetical protein
MNACDGVEKVFGLYRVEAAKRQVWGEQGQKECDTNAHDWGLGFKSGGHEISHMR